MSLRLRPSRRWCTSSPTPSSTVMGSIGRGRSSRSRSNRVAFIVCDALGLDTSDYSFAYVARWSDGFSGLVKDTAERVIDCPRALLIGLEAIKDAGDQL